MILPPKRKARLNPLDMHDLYSCLMAYRNTYYPYDKEGFDRITELMNEVKGVYERDCPEEPPISQPRYNRRCAGRKKKYTEDFDAKIISLHKEGLTVKEIVIEMKCSKSYAYNVLKWY